MCKLLSKVTDILCFFLHFGETKQGWGASHSITKAVSMSLLISVVMDTHVHRQADRFYQEGKLDVEYLLSKRHFILERQSKTQKPIKQVIKIPVRGIGFYFGICNLMALFNFMLNFERNSSFHWITSHRW